MAETKTQALQGGEFLIRESDPQDIFIPEEFNEEQLMIAQTCVEFLQQHVWNQLDDIDHQKEGLMADLLNKAGELGLLGISVPEDLGGFGKDFVTGMLATERTGAGHSFSVAIAAHTGIGTLPILYYGNDAQRKKYIPKLASGEWKACYCLTEPGSGSDANSGKTKAVLSADGKHYVLNGQKMWITNGGFADVFTVFAKIDDDENLSAFIVEKDFGGITLNPEEHKMGIKGSSTRQVFFNDCKVPVENLLSERQNGFKIAVNILNIGRIKLAGATLGGSKKTIDLSVQYANERQQFGRPISSFGAIRQKLADMAVYAYVTESALYRCSRDMENAIEALEAGGADHAKALLKGVEQYAAEAAILKVAGSECLDFIVDEGVQIYGGMGYSAESPVERAYRDSRINRIFEGTNEINRMLTVDMLLKRAMKGQLDLLGPAQAVAAELMGIPDMPEPDDSLLADEKRMVANFKKAVLMTAGGAAQKLGLELAKHQETLMHIADMVIDTYMAESVLLRTLKLAEMRGVNGANGEGSEKVAEQLAMCQLYIHDAADRIHKYAKEAVNNFAEGDEQRAMLMGAKRFAKNTPINTAELRKLVAKKMIAEGKYCY
ncbi:MAG TPA: acyl-CoA dehydrogenase family protein [Flavobacteriales bacterium]|nr:acyl-CoA dehydrogenase family protein [Flavobacteriales bacterium]HMZ47367.1 acyl-CoA dehydrogenase family protein [Flavobacteriales bacterium]HNK67998.1 acyl-CoA dehydrogenase family protein [Flavobacteriales bacterium]HNO05051.1 acyl-CoA dehydrogenase family protein [Flavobacteriales bacterium]